VCVGGTYSTSVGATSIGTCQPCPSNTFSAAQSGARQDCYCNAGYSGVGGDNCVACIAGTYKINAGPQVCTDCGDNKYSTIVAAISADTCQSCSTFAYSSPGSKSPSACICQGGYFDPANFGVTL
jgi:hypothetical protein